MLTTIEFITALFCQVDDHLSDIPKHPEAHLWPSEVVTLGLLHALKGVGNRPFYRRAWRCWGSGRHRELLSLHVQVWIPALEDASQFPVQCPHSRL